MKNYEDLEKEIDTILESRNCIEKTPSQSKPSFIRRCVLLISNVLFYGLIIVLLVSIALFSQKGSKVTNIAGYSPFHITSRSMQSVMPKGSLIFSQTVEPYEIQVGDDISFFMKIGSKVEVVTHRVVSINLETPEEGMSFVTKGVDNPEPDKGKVYDSDIIGVVCLVIPQAGMILDFVRNNVLVVAGNLAVLFALIYFVGNTFKKEDADDEVQSLMP